MLAICGNLMHVHIQVSVCVLWLQECDLNQTAVWISHIDCLTDVIWSWHKIIFPGQPTWKSLLLHTRISIVHILLQPSSLLTIIGREGSFDTILDESIIVSNTVVILQSLHSGVKQDHVHIKCTQAASDTAREELMDSQEPSAQQREGIPQYHVHVLHPTTCMYMYVLPQDYRKSLDMMFYYAYIRLYVIVCYSGFILLGMLLCSSWFKFSRCFQ